MAKNKTELQTELKALGEQLGVPVELDQTNDELAENIKELQARVAAKDSVIEDPAEDEPVNKVTETEKPATEEQATDEPVTDDFEAENQETEKMVVVRALKTFQTTDLGEKVRCKKDETAVLTVKTAQLCIADKVAIAVAQ